MEYQSVSHMDGQKKTIRDRIRTWLRMDADFERQLVNSGYLARIECQLAKLEVLIKDPPIVAAGPKVNFRPAVPTDFEGLSLQALHDLEKEAN